MANGWMLNQGKTFDTVNPATGEVLAKIQEGGKADIDKAVKAARKAFETGPWRNKMSAAERARCLYKLADLIEQRVDELAQLETLDNGKPIKEARYFDIPAVAETFRYYAGWATKLEGETINVNNSFFTYTLREPVIWCSWSNYSLEFPYAHIGCKLEIGSSSCLLAIL